MRKTLLAGLSLLALAGSAWAGDPNSPCTTQLAFDFIGMFNRSIWARHYGVDVVDVGPMQYVPAKNPEDIYTPLNCRTKIELSNGEFQTGTIVRRQSRGDVTDAIIEWHPDPDKPLPRNGTEWRFE